MKKLKLSNVTTSIAQPIKSGSLQHIQDAFKEAVAETIKGFIGSAFDPTKAYLLRGCVNSGSGDNFVISAGAIFMNDEVFLVPDATFTATAPQFAIGTITTSYNTGLSYDPVQFTDGVNRNVHEIRQIVFAPGLAGSGDIDFVNLQHVNLVRAEDVLTLTNETAYAPTDLYHPATKKYVDDNIAGVKLLLYAFITWTGSAYTITKIAGSASGVGLAVTRLGAGKVTITHNVGVSTYFLTGMGTDQTIVNGTVNPRSVGTKNASSCIVVISDDDSPGDSSFEVHIWGY